MKLQIGAQSEIENRRASENICAHLENSSLDCARIAVYLATPREPNIDDFIRYLQAKKISVFAPAENENQPAFISVADDWSNIQLTSRGWRTPLEYSLSRRCAAAELDLIILPGLAFDASGARLGQGGGWYDRALQDVTKGVLCIGVCFDFQVVEFVPREAHDQSVSIIVTDKRILYV